MGTPSLVVEILSPSSRSLDMIKKLNTYMLSGVNEYWMADPDNKTVIVYIFKDRKIENFITYKNDEVVSSRVFNGMVAPLSEVFD